jgi:3-hydroxyisobutyrate dehydrogenase-like beta-hydroxyacid dehydrogenase
VGTRDIRRGVSVGFVGLGNMGSALAANLVATGHDLVTHDVAGPERSPEGATFVDAIESVAQGAGVVVLSCPTGPRQSR